MVKGIAVELAVDHARRASIRANHSATHLLHEALRQVLGPHVAQKGSLVGPDRLRFDFSHQKPMTEAELVAVEDMANVFILRNEPVVTRLMGLDEARSSGARALFGEKYGDEVRVVSMGTVAGESGETRPYSIELCGGTHAHRTGDIGLVSLVGESAVSAGIRRLEAKTATTARQHLNEDSRRLHVVAGLLKAPADSVAERLTALIDDRKRLDRELSEARKRLAMGAPNSAGDSSTRTVAGVSYFARAISGVEMKDLKGLADEAKQSIGSGVVAIVGVAPDGKAGLVVAVTKDMTARFNAVDLVRVGAERLGGKGGGGRPDMAQAGGPNGTEAEAALDAIAKTLSAGSEASAAERAGNARSDR